MNLPASVQALKQKYAEQRLAKTVASKSLQGKNAKKPNRNVTKEELRKGNEKEKKKIKTKGN